MQQNKSAEAEFFQRFAPDRKRDDAPAHEQKPLALAFRYLWLALRVAWLRRTFKLRIALHRMGHSLFCAWALGGFGWGMAVLFALTAFMLWR